MEFWVSVSGSVKTKLYWKRLSRLLVYAASLKQNKIFSHVSHNILRPAKIEPSEQEAPSSVVNSVSENSTYTKYVEKHVQLFKYSLSCKKRFKLLTKNPSMFVNLEEESLTCNFPEE